jgi:hypothetical protein
MTALLRVSGFLLLYAAAIAGANVGGLWDIPFLVAALLMFFSGPVIRELRRPGNQKRRAIFMLASTICWVIFTLTLYHDRLYFYETKATWEGAVFALLTLVSGPLAIVFWDCRDPRSYGNIVRQ